MQTMRILRRANRARAITSKHENPWQSYKHYGMRMILNSLLPNVIMKQTNPLKCSKNDTLIAAECGKLGGSHLVVEVVVQKRRS
jgi:hypothetical protein